MPYSMPLSGCEQQTMFAQRQVRTFPCNKMEKTASVYEPIADEPRDLGKSSKIGRLSHPCASYYKFPSTSSLRTFSELPAVSCARKSSIVCRRLLSEERKKRNARRYRMSQSAACIESQISVRNGTDVLILEWRDSNSPYGFFS